MIQVLTIFCVLVYLGGLLAAAAWDLGSYTIPNRIVILIAVAGLAALGLAGGGWHSLLDHGGTALVVLAVGALMFFFHIWGAGDAKLLAAVALWTGSHGLSVLVFWTAVVGGVLAIFLLVIRRLRFINTAGLKLWCGALLSSTHGVPYGVAIAAGGVIAFISNQTVLGNAILPH